LRTCTPSSQARHPIETLVPQATPTLRALLAQALHIDASARPTLDALRDALRAEPGVLVHTKPKDPLPATTKPWWKLW
jgi:hypothetical protein